jgi:hypothetical protein
LGERSTCLSPTVSNSHVASRSLSDDASRKTSRCRHAESSINVASGKPWRRQVPHNEAQMRLAWQRQNFICEKHATKPPVLLASNLVSLCCMYVCVFISYYIYVYTHCTHINPHTTRNFSAGFEMLRGGSIATFTVCGVRVCTNDTMIPTYKMIPTCNDTDMQ